MGTTPDGQHNQPKETPMTRTRASAKSAGSTFERQTADYLNEHVDDRIDRRVKTGAKDRGDIGGVRIHGQRVVIECKNVTKANISGWLAEAEIERGNDDALVGIVVAKRHGKGRAEDQLVHMTLGTLVALLTGDRAHLAVVLPHMPAGTS